MKLIATCLAATAAVAAASANGNSKTTTTSTATAKKKLSFQMMIVCEKDHYKECEKEIERFEGIEITNYMIYTPNMFAAKLSNQEEDPHSVMERVKDLPHVADVEEDHVITIHKKPIDTDKKVSKEDLEFENERISNKKGLFSNILKDAKISRGDNDNDTESRGRKLRDMSHLNRNQHQHKDLKEGFERKARTTVRRELQAGTLPANEQTIPYGIYQVNAVNFWAQHGKGSGSKVCVLNTGVINLHEDFDSSKLNGSGGTQSLPYDWVGDWMLVF